MFVSAQQPQGKKLREQDYAKWHSVQPEGISADGKWLSYRLSYEYAADTLFLKSTFGKKKYAFPLGRKGRFIGNSSFACVGPENSLVITELQNGKQRMVPHVSKFQLLDGKRLLLSEFDSLSRKSIAIRSADGKILWEEKDITDYELDKAQGRLAFSTFSSGESKAYILDIGKKIVRSKAIATGSHPIRLFSWHLQGASVAFAEIGADSRGRRNTEKAYHHSLVTKNTKVLDRSAPGFPEGKQLAPATNNDFRLADDGKRLFLALTSLKPRAKRSPQGIQVWNSLDKRIYPMALQMADEGPYVFSFWDTEKGTVEMIGNGGTEGAVLAGSQQHAIFFDYLKYEPAEKKWADVDICIQDLDTGKKSLVLERFSGNLGRISVSPARKYIAYFLDGDWWLYSLETGLHAKATRKELGVLTERDYDRPDAPPCAELLWLPGDSAFLYCDQNDIWKFTVAGGRSERLTDGKENDMVYRIHGQGSRESDRFRTGAALRMDLPITVYGRKLDYSATGFFTLSSRKLDTLAFAKSKLSGLLFAGNRGAFTYMEERSDLPPRIMRRKIKAPDAAIAVATNQQHYDYNLGTAELLRYKDSSGKMLGAILHYPANYDPGKKYPMVVQVYEKMTWKYNEYVRPTIFNETGFNAAVLSAEGYFVLRPDIYYREGRAGLSALDCVIAAADAAIASASVDRKKIGLMGASFGGFETQFIISNSNAFAAAIAGSGMSDFVSGYLSANRNESRSESYRYETDQPRMGKALFEDWEGYRENSPIWHAGKVTAPVLLWVGMNDGQVNPDQTMNFYMALRKLGKECTMLRYEGEDHAMREVENQRDLSLRTLEWFNYYLKGGSKPAWTFPEHR